jgi:hypothetical protein
LKNSDNYKIPLVIGITGHRDILDKHIKSLEAKVHEIYSYIIKKYPNTPIILLTPLADGADRIVAKVALSEFQDKITVSVPLPLDEENYKKTFAKGMTNYKLAQENCDNKMIHKLEIDSIQEYNDLVQKVNRQKNDYVPKHIAMIFDKVGYINLSPQNQRLMRRKQYSIVGEYIALHSNILVAIYDDLEKEKPGGTKEIVRKKLTGDFEYFKIKNSDVTYPENGVVYSVSVSKGDSECNTNYQIKKLFPDSIGKNGLLDLRKNQYNFLESLVLRLEDIITKSCIPLSQKSKYNLYTQYHKNIECFNKEVDKNIGTIQKKAESDIQKINRCDDKLIHKNIMMRRSAAYLAGFYQSKMNSLEKYILVLIGMAIFLLVFSSDFQSFIFTNYIQLAYILLIGIFLVLYKRFKSYKEKTENFRALSEALRVQIAWNMANINDATALYYLSHQKDEIGWIRTAVRGINIFYIPNKETTLFDLNQVNQYWVDEQINYFGNNLNKYKSKESNSNKKINKYFYIFIFFTATFILLEITTNINMCTTGIYGLNLIDFIKILLIGVPATITAYLKSKQFFDGSNDILKEYTLSLFIFQRAKALLGEKNINPKEVIKNLGIEALRENSSWLITRRTKEYEVPA